MDKQRLITFILGIFAALLAFGAYIGLNEFTATTTESGTSTASLPVIVDEPISAVKINVGEQQTIAVTGTATELPEFAQLVNGELTLSPTRDHIGSYEFTVGDENFFLEIEMKKVDMDELVADIEQILGDKRDNFGIYIHDIYRDQTATINGGTEYWPGSVAKLPVVILALRDIDSGKLDWDDTFTVQNDLKHSSYDNIGRLSAGTPVTIKTLIDKTINVSNNSAMYHLRAAIGGIDEVYTRTETELGVSAFNDLPHHVAKAQEVGKVLRDVYNAETLSPESSNYLLDLMKNSVASLRDGIPAALNGYDVEVASKVGFLYGKGKDAYNDVAIVFGDHTDYILVVVDKDTKYNQGRDTIRQIAKQVHTTLDI